MGGDGSGRKPDPFKALLRSSQPNNTMVASNMVLPNLSGVKHELQEGTKSKDTLRLHAIETNSITADTSAGLTLKADNGDTAVLISAGGGKNITFYDGVKLDSGTASKVLVTDANKNISYSTLSSTDLDAIPTTYAKLDATNQPFTGNIEVRKSQQVPTYLWVNNDNTGGFGQASFRAGLNSSNFNTDYSSFGILNSNAGAWSAFPVLPKAAYLEASGSNFWIGNLNATEPISFHTTSSRTERMRITGDTGRVGIGDTAPPSIVSIKLSNTDYTNTAGAGSHLVMTNPSSTGQNVICSIINGSTVAKWRTDYVGNISWVAGGSGVHSFYTGGDYGIGSEKVRITSAGRFGVMTTAPDKQVEINSTDGNCLRLTYNDNNGSASYYSDFKVSSSGDLTITASGGDISFDNENLVTTGTFQAGGYKSSDGSAGATGSFTSADGKTITVKDGLITAIV